MVLLGIYILATVLVQANQQLFNQNGIGGWGGWCRCPDGERLGAGDHNNACGSIACEGGVNEGCQHHVSSDWQGKKVICSPAQPCTTGVNFSPTGKVPCTACTPCSQGFKRTCSATQNAICGYNPECQPVTGYECHQGVRNTDIDQGLDFNEGECFDVTSRATCIERCNDDPQCTMFEFTGDENPENSSPRCCLEYCNLNKCTNFDFSGGFWDLYVREEDHNSCSYCMSWGDPHITNFAGQSVDNMEEKDNLLFQYGVFKVIGTQKKVPFNVAINQEVFIEDDEERIFTMQKNCGYSIGNPEKIKFIALARDNDLNNKQHGMSRSYWPTSKHVAIWDYMIKLPDAMDELSIFFSCGGESTKFTNVGIKHCGELTDVSGYCAEVVDVPNAEVVDVTSESVENPERRALQANEVCGNLDACCKKFVGVGDGVLQDSCLTDAWHECCDLESGNLFMADETCCDFLNPKCDVDFTCSPGEACDPASGTCHTVTTPDDCEGAWTDYTPCSTNCGKGALTRTFNVMQVATEGGVPCTAEDQEEHVVTCLDYTACPTIYKCASWGDVHFWTMDGGAFNIHGSGTKNLFSYGTVAIKTNHKPFRAISVNDRAWVEVNGQTLASISLGSCSMSSSNTQLAVVGPSNAAEWAAGLHPQHFQFMVTFPEQPEVYGFFMCDHTWVTPYINVGVKLMGDLSLAGGLCAGGGSDSEMELALPEAEVGTEEEDIPDFVRPTGACQMVTDCCNTFISEDFLVDGCLIDAEFTCCAEGANVETCCDFFSETCDVDFECGWKECCDHNSGLCVECTQCVDGETFNDLGGFAPCMPCKTCATDVIQECTKYSNTACEECEDDDLCLQLREGFVPGDLCMSYMDDCETNMEVSSCCPATCGLCAEYNAKGICVPPENAARRSGGKACPDDGTCLDGTPYEDLDMAWHQCTLNPDCSYIVEKENGQFLIFRESDPELGDTASDTVITYDCMCVDGETYSINGEVPCAPCTECPLGYKSQCTTTEDAVCKNACGVGAWSETGIAPCMGCVVCETYAWECKPDSNAVCGTPPPFYLSQQGECPSPIMTYDECEEANQYLELYKKGTRAVKRDTQIGASWDPPYCYFEWGKVKFNEGSNTGECNPKDSCVCANPEDEQGLAATLGISAKTLWNVQVVVGLGSLAFGFGYAVKLMGRKKEDEVYLLQEEEC